MPRDPVIEVIHGTPLGSRCHEQAALLIAELFEEGICRGPPYGHNGIWLDDVEGDFLLELDPRWRNAP